MSDIPYPFTERSATTLSWLLPPGTVTGPTEPVIQTHLLMSDYLRIRSLIGAPATLDRQLIELGLNDHDRLPALMEAVLLNGVTLFALAMEVFDDRATALRWWTTPLTLKVDGPMQSPCDWLAVPGAATELADRITRTLHGIY